MFLSHADSVPITDSRTLKPSFIVIFVPSNSFMALSDAFPYYELTLGRLHIVSESLSVHIQFVQYCAETPKISWQRFRHLRTIFGCYLVFAGAQSVGLLQFRTVPLRGYYLSLYSW